jgi:7-keto-8-aminopelargonate synthetase-like enzyme
LSSTTKKSDDAGNRYATSASEIPSAIIPFIIGDESAAVTAAQRLREQGIYIPAIRYPTVARGQARLRITLTANHTRADVSQLLSAIATV